MLSFHSSNLFQLSFLSYECTTLQMETWLSRGTVYGIELVEHVYFLSYPEITSYSLSEKNIPCLISSYRTRTTKRLLILVGEGTGKKGNNSKAA